MDGLVAPLTVQLRLNPDPAHTEEFGLMERVQAGARGVTVALSSSSSLVTIFPFWSRRLHGVESIS